jgi:cytochrome c oxidase subunit 3
LSDSATTVHGPELRHHFSDVQQQRDASNFGMWLFLVTEVMFFGGMFLAYLVYRMAYFNDFAAASRSIAVPLGAVNTAVLLCSSLTVVLAVRAAQMGKRKLLIAMLILTLIFGLAFLGIKGYEWHEKYVEHHIPGHFMGRDFDVSDIQRAFPQLHVDPRHAQIFFSLYFAMTGIHALHMIIGLGIFLWLLAKAWKGDFGPQYYTPVEICGLYWHFVDVVWIYLFPLLYLIDRKPL